MKLKPSTIIELKKILEEEFNLYLDDKDINKLAYSLVGYFDLLKRIENRHRFGNHPDRVIDSSSNTGFDKKEVK